MNFADDLDAAAELGWGPDKLDELARIGFQPGQLASFRALEPETRQLVLRQLDSPTDADHAELAAHPAGRSLAQWLLTLPAYANVSDAEEDEGIRKVVVKWLSIKKTAGQHVR